MPKKSRTPGKTTGAAEEVPSKKQKLMDATDCNPGLAYILASSAPDKETRDHYRTLYEAVTDNSATNGSDGKAPAKTLPESAAKEGATAAAKKGKGAELTVRRTSTRVKKAATVEDESETEEEEDGTSSDTESEIEVQAKSTPKRSARKKIPGEKKEGSDEEDTEGSPIE